ncbi:DESI2 [Symbiodinium sp. KB8]|nr:DESI2 [Symbiodinium sp. KB8]
MLLHSLAFSCISCAFVTGELHQEARGRPPSARNAATSHASPPSRDRSRSFRSHKWPAAGGEMKVLLPNQVAEDLHQDGVLKDIASKSKASVDLMEAVGELHQFVEGHRLLIIRGQAGSELQAAVEDLLGKARLNGRAHGPGGSKLKILLPRHLAAVVIGRRGANIKDLQRTTGTSVQVENGSTGMDRVATVCGSPAAILNALGRIHSFGTEDEEGVGSDGPDSHDRPYGHGHESPFQNRAGDHSGPYRHDGPDGRDSRHGVDPDGPQAERDGRPCSDEEEESLEDNRRKKRKPPPKPAAPWEVREHPEAPGEFYYLNMETGDTTWERPAGNATGLEKTGMQLSGVGSNIPPPWAEVALSIYELHGTSALNLLTRAADMGGAYHVGVEVYWLEWSFGWCEEGSGVYMVFPGQSTLGTFRERVPLGRTPLSPDEVFRVLDKMRQELPGSNYDLLRCNCAHFSVSFVKRLRVSEAPSWVNSLANVGEHLVGQLGMAGAQAAAAAATPAESDRVAPRYVHFGDEEELEDLAGDGDDQAMRELAWRRAQAFVSEKLAEAERDARLLDLAMELKWTPTTEDVEQTAARVSEVLQDPRLMQALAEASAAGFGLPCPFLREQEAGWSLLGDDSEEELEEDGCCGNLEVRKLLKGQGRLVTVRVRLRGTALNEKGAAPAWRGVNFREALRLAVAPKRGLSIRWPAGMPQIIANMEIVTAPDQALFGSRVETSCGPYGGKVLHSNVRPTAPVASKLVGKRATPAPVPRRIEGSGELQRWQQEQQELWNARREQMPRWKWQVQQLQVKPRAVPAERHGLSPQDLRLLDFEPAGEKVQESLLRLQKIQQLDRMRRAAHLAPHRP